MLFTLDDKKITTVPHPISFNAAIRALGPKRVSEVRAELNSIIDEMPPGDNGARTFSSSYLGSKLSPWKHPLIHLYHVAKEFEGKNPDEKKSQDRAALLFGLFVWECIINRTENWSFYDPNLNSQDVNREPMGKIYFERI